MNWRLKYPARAVLSRAAEWEHRHGQHPVSKSKAKKKKKRKIMHEVAARQFCL
jgi:hypothetical protein